MKQNFKLINIYINSESFIFIVPNAIYEFIKDKQNNIKFKNAKDVLDYIYKLKQSVDIIEIGECDYDLEFIEDEDDFVDEYERLLENEKDFE